MTTRPGEPADGSPYDPGIPTELGTVYDPNTLHNFDSATLEGDQEIGHQAQELFCDRSGFRGQLVL